MATLRMPPRQKMINMMYLVLTAMLAMNVSKEVLDAFAIMDSELVRSERAHEQRSLLEYTVFADAAKRFPEKFTVPHENALRVKQQADSLVAYIERIKVDAVATADGLSPVELVGKDNAGRDTLRALLVLEAKDDRETLTRMLVGSAPDAPKHGPGTAHDLKLRIMAFRDSLRVLAGDRNKDLSAALDLLFDLGPRRDASGTMNNWESINFYDVPLAAGVATLSKLQADIRSSENDIVKWLYRSAELKDYRFGTLTTAVVPQSSLIMAGDSFRADVFLAAYDPKNRPTVTVDGGAPLPIGNDGKAKLRLRDDRIGEQVVHGLISFEGPDGPEEVAYSTRYQVMAPLLVASPTKMNVLFRGVENPVELSVPGVPADRVRATIDNGRIVRNGAGWVASGMVGNTAQVYAFVAQADGTERRVGPVRFRVKDLPPPTAYIAGTTPLAVGASKPQLGASRGIVAKPLDVLFDEDWVVQRFELSVVRKGGIPVSLATAGNAFTAEMKEVLAAVRPNDQVYVEGIKARLANGEGPVRQLSPIALKVIR
ncbi:MAG: gliding motility protein GldM [Flavobacteriales bacterium]